MTYLPQSIGTYKSLQSFEDVEQMNNAVKEHKQAHELTNTDREVLDAISRYACKYIGVTYLSKANIAKATGFVRRTVIRACKRLEALGIIEQYETRRINGDRRQSSNIIVISNVNYPTLGNSNYAPVSDMANVETLKRIPHNQNGVHTPISNVCTYTHSNSPSVANMADVETLGQLRPNANTWVNESPSTHSNRTPESDIADSHTEVTPQGDNVCHAGESHQEALYKAISSNTLLETKTSDTPTTSEIIKRGLRHAIPTPIYDALEPFLDGQALYDTYGILLRAKAKIDRNIALETHYNRYIDAFYNVIRLHKNGQVRSFNGLLYVTWERLTAEISRQQPKVDTGYFDWLSEA